jgi:NAD(P)-dependent dehydrogenase (short-subunit alcohol dehydrogenase family)
MNINLADKVVVITGGAGKIGSEFVQAVAASGAVAVIADANDAAGRTLAAEICNIKGLRAEFHSLDITSKESAQRLIATLDENHGRIDALVNNAYPRNSRYGRKFEDVTFDDFCDNMGMHVGGYFLMSQQFGNYFRTRGHGNIINLASIYGVVAPRFEIYDGTPMTMPVEYAAIKSAVIHLTRYLARHYKGCNIRVNCISPGGILDKQPESFLAKYGEYALSKGMLDPQDITGTLIYLLSDFSAYVNGQNILVDDGWSL